MKGRNLQSCRRSQRLRRFNQSNPDFPLRDSNLLLVDTDRRRTSDRRKDNDIKFVVRPGYLEVDNGHCLYIDKDKLIELYDVATSECTVLHNDDENFDAKFCRYISCGYIFLYPRADGNYSWYKN